MSSLKKNHDFLQRIIQRITSGLFGIANSFFSSNTEDTTTVPVPTSTVTHDEDTTVGAGVFPFVVVDQFPDPDTTSTSTPTPTPTPTTINEEDDGFNLEEYHAEQQRKKMKEGSRYNAYDDDASTNNQEVKNIMCSFLPNDCPLINALTYCANCNKKAEPFTTLKICTACRSVSYCSDCQQVHRKDHNHQCKQDVQGLKMIKENLMTHQDTDDDNGDLLFQPIPPIDDCSICTLPLPIAGTGKLYYSCCGKIICRGCSIKNDRIILERGLKRSCAFCREASPTSDNENIIRIKKRMKLNDSEAIFMASHYYKIGQHGLPQDLQRAFGLCLRAAELGNSNACCNVSTFYEEGVAVQTDLVKSMEYCKEAAKKGNIYARNNLGTVEYKTGNHRVASRHWLISAAAGDTVSLTNIAELYRREVVNKNEYTTALASYSNVHKDEWSIEREVAAAAAADETRQQNSSSN